MKTKIRKSIASFLLLVMIFSLSGMKFEKEVRALDVQGYKVYLPDGTRINSDNQVVIVGKQWNEIVLYGIDYVISISILDPALQADAGQYQTEKIPAKKNYVFLNEDLKYIIPSNLSIVSFQKRNKKTFFLSGKEIRNYSTKFGNFSLMLNEHVFPPSEHGTKSFLNYIQIESGEKVIDIGTGAGILAITAAKAGAEVYATDIQSVAIKLTKKNATLNKVNVHASVGEYFASFIEEDFDVIIANLPQEIIPPAYSKEIGDLQETISGGEKGNEVLLPFLDILATKMKKNTRAYILVYTVTNYLESLNKISQLFDAKLINTEVVGTKHFVAENEKFYKKLSDEGKIYVFKDKEEWKALIYVFELIKKSS